ncbi:PaaI family thioesterase [Zavarzinia sp.]|uniref:PaaI family thioesterase n=1 Tax=Zavarzinia sp. TaxID=2027920 RepID=UPI003565FA74
MLPLRETDPLFQRIAESFDRQTFARGIGMVLTVAEPGRVAVELPFDQGLTQQNGVLHAGVTTSLADTAAGFAALTLMPDDANVMSVEFKINLMAPAAGQRFVADAKVIRSGRTLSTVEARVTAYDAAGKGAEVASFLGTMICLRPR